MNVYERDYTSLQRYGDDFLKYDNDTDHSSGIRMVSEEELVHAYAPEKYDFYQICLNRLESYVMRHRGKIRGVFSSEIFGGTIRVTVPVCMFEGAEDMQDLLLIASRADAVHFGIKDGEIVFDITVRCFLRVMD